MRPEEKRQGALEELDELLSRKVLVEDAIVQAADNNDMKPADLRIVVTRLYGDLEEHARKMQLRMLNEAISAEIKRVSLKVHPKNLFHDCYDPDQVAAAVESAIGWRLNADEFQRIHALRRDFMDHQFRELKGRLGL